MQIARFSFAIALTLAPTRAAVAAEPVIVDAGPDWSVILSGQLRPRVFVHSGLDFRGEASETREIVTQRARLGAILEEASGLAFQLQLQDVRAWGEEDDTRDFDANGFDVHQANAVIPVVDTLRVKLGRQEISLDEERLVGAIQWSQRGQSFDGATLLWNSLDERFTITGLYAKIQEPGQSPDATVPAGRDGDIDLGGVHTSIEVRGAHAIAPLYLVHIKQAPNDVRHTIGLSGKGGGQGFEYVGEAYYQFGKIDDATIQAYLLTLRLGYTFDVPIHPRIVLWAEGLSGDGTPEGTVDTLYATNHDFYGEMDFFLNIPRDTANLGLIDLGGRIGTDIVGNLRGHVDGHLFRSFEPGPTGNADLGAEVDFKLLYQANDFVAVRALYGLFLPGRLMRTVKGYEPTDPLDPDSLFYLTADVRF